MLRLPAIGEKLIERPGQYGGYKRKVVHLVPDLAKHSDFWNDFYKKISKLGRLQFPVAGAEKSINPYFGHFGYRFHPVILKPRYFHIGIDINQKAKTKVRPIGGGVFEYAGFGHINGKYILLSHPDIKTEDGFILHSLYMHLRDMYLSFSPYQKMLREISLHNYPEINVAKEKIIGTVGNTGYQGEISSNLHLQIEFRKRPLWEILGGGGEVAAINPASCFNLPSPENLSAKIKSQRAFLNFQNQNKLA